MKGQFFSMLSATLKKLLGAILTLLLLGIHLFAKTLELIATLISKITTALLKKY